MGSDRTFHWDLALIELLDEIEEAMDKIEEAMDNKKHMDLHIAVICPKAFDTLNLSILLQKLSNYGIHVLQPWLVQKLLDRTQSNM